MTLRDSVLDDSTALAKSLGHDTVRAGHVVVAILARQERRPVPGALDPVTDAEVQQARALLPAPGVSIRPPALDEHAIELARLCTSPETAVAAAREFLAHLARSGGDQSGPAEVDPAYVSAAYEPSASESPGTPAPLTAGHDEDLASALAELDALVGLPGVKTRIRQLVALQEVNRVRLTLQLPALPVGLNLVFVGDPGTGKTTVARVVARIYRALGVLETGHLVEVGRSDLVAGYVGQTAERTSAVLARADGGVLFIDEAYSLAADPGGFGREALSSLVDGMEDRKGRIAVIAAGYSKEMSEFLDANPGLRSRFQTVIEFPPYTDEELLAIFQSMCRQHQVACDSEVEAAVTSYLTSSATGGAAGNGRFVRNLFEEMTVRLATRAADDGHVDDDEVRAFASSDVPQSVGDRRRTGFVP